VVMLGAFFLSPQHGMERALIAQLVTFLKSESGATALEYVLMAAFLGVGIAVVVSNLGTGLSGEYSEISGSLK
jgi:pilus assembly protein Flp/PilA